MVRSHKPRTFENLGRLGFQALDLRTRLRQARKSGVSPEIVPSMTAYDEDGFEGIDPDGDIRVSRFDQFEHQFYNPPADDTPLITADDVANSSAPAPPSGGTNEAASAVE